MLAAARGNDGAVGYGADGVIVENDAHFGKSGGQTCLADEVGEEVDALVGILYQPDFLCPATEFFFCALVDMAIDDGMQYGKPLAMIAVGVGAELVLYHVTLEVSHLAKFQNAIFTHSRCPHQF